MIISPHTARRFPEAVDYVTSLGYLGNKADSEEFGLRGGPEAVYRQGIIGFADDSEMIAERTHPGATCEQI
jgi:glutaconate CoA-transferase subunit B